MTGSLRYLPLIGRILIAALFLSSGFEKVSQFQGNIAYAAKYGMPAPTLAIIGAVAIELGGGILLLVGFRVRWIAAAIAIYAIIAALVFHTNFSDTNEQLHFLKDLAIAGGLLQLAYFGAGPLALDNRK